ncbi:MAG: hypothetical protein IT210_03570 [Armatimonadetes bacterium]|nr:hypothetical protein [Armatimonadota bacterium]
MNERNEREEFHQALKELERQRAEAQKRLSEQEAARLRRKGFRKQLWRLGAAGIILLMLLIPQSPVNIGANYLLSTWRHSELRKGSEYRLHYRSNVARLKEIRDRLSKDSASLQKLWKNPGSHSGQVWAAALFSSLSDGQIEEMWRNKRAARKGLPGRSLRPEQFRLLAQIVSSYNSEETNRKIDLGDATILFDPNASFTWFYTDKLTGEVISGGCGYRPEGWMSGS